MPLDASVCPLCGKANQCAMEAEKATGRAQPPCWCAGLKMDASLLEKIPANQRGLACVCQDCATMMQTPPST
jgi:hypothetical protein